MTKRLAILISGSGSTMQGIIKASKSGEIPIDVACVIASTPNAGGIEKARLLGISDKDILVIDPNEFREIDKKINQKRFGEKILKELRLRGVNVVTQNGWMPLTPQNVVKEYSGRIFNQHPGPVPEFGGKGMYGRRVHSARLLFVRMTQRDFWTEAIAQKVDADFDKGAVVKSRKVKIFPEDTVEELQKRLLPIEHQVQIELLKDFVSGNLKVVGRKRIVKIGEEKILNKAKKIAQLLYPLG